MFQEDKNSTLPKIPTKCRNYLLKSNKRNDMLVFRSPIVENNLIQCRTILLDGTYKCLLPFPQLLMVHGLNAVTNKVVLMFYAFTYNYVESAYRIFLEVIKKEFPTWKPTRVTFDCNDAMKAIQEVFPGTPSIVSYYHYYNSLIHKANELKLISKVEKRHIARCASLPLLPSNMLSGYKYTMERAPRTKQVYAFNKFIDHNYLKDIRIIKNWCFNPKDMEMMDHIERWHAKLYRFIGNKSLSIDKMLIMFHKEASSGKVVKTKSSKEIDDEIDTAIKEFKSEKITVGHCLEIISAYKF